MQNLYVILYNHSKNILIKIYLLMKIKLFKNKISFKNTYVHILLLIVLEHIFNNPHILISALTNM